MAADKKKGQDYPATPHETISDAEVLYQCMHTDIIDDIIRFSFYD